MEEFPNDCNYSVLQVFIICAKKFNMEPTETRRNGALADQISAPNFYSLCSPRVATKLWDRFLIFCAVAGVFFRKGGPPPISGTRWDVKPKFSGYVGTLSMQLPVEGILLPVTISGSTDDQIFYEGKTGGHFLDPQRDLWNATDIQGCGKEFAMRYAIQPRRRSKVSASRGQNAKGQFSKKKFLKQVSIFM